MSLTNLARLAVSCFIRFIGRDQVLPQVHPEGMNEVGNQGSPASAIAQDYDYRQFTVQESCFQSRKNRFYYWLQSLSGKFPKQPLLVTS